MELVIGTKRWSTWSMRPWLVLRRAGAAFEETPVQLRQGPDTKAAILAHSGAGKVPILKDGELVVWDSLAICEYLAERLPEARLWPAEAAARAMARSACAEMHAGFPALRQEAPMALGEPTRASELSEAAGADSRRIVGLWRQMLARFGGPFLAGEWSIADAFYTPVATRFRTYGVKLSDYGDEGRAGAYCQRLLETPEYVVWERGALAEI
ncbi:MAG: glutathione S-transferase family protein [Phenylobacterium sp.]